MIYPKKTLFLRLDVGSAANEQGGKFEMSVNAGDHTPIIRLPDGRWWSIGWQEMLAMAEEEATES